MGDKKEQGERSSVLEERSSEQRKSERELDKKACKRLWEHHGDNNGDVCESHRLCKTGLSMRGPGHHMTSEGHDKSCQPLPKRYKIAQRRRPYEVMMKLLIRK